EVTGGNSHGRCTSALAVIAAMNSASSLRVGVEISTRAMAQIVSRLMRSHRVKTDRLEMQLIESGPEDGIPVVLIHGNLSTGRFYEHLFDDAPSRYRLLAPDMRGFGDTERVPIDATRGLRDWADDVAALLRALEIDAPPHLVGWSTGG